MVQTVIWIIKSWHMPYDLVIQPFNLHLDYMWTIACQQNGRYMLHWHIRDRAFVEGILFSKDLLLKNLIKEVFILFLLFSIQHISITATIPDENRSLKKNKQLMKLQSKSIGIDWDKRSSRVEWHHLLINISSTFLQYVFRYPKAMLFWLCSY